jgi:hypothetical protein
LIFAGRGRVGVNREEKREEGLNILQFGEKDMITTMR